MNVLLLEDRGAAAFYVVEWLRKERHTVLEAFNLNDAQSHWGQRDKVPIDCIILDLSLPTDGLSDKQRERSEGGLLSGWIWLNDKVLLELPEMRQRTIIYSDYIPTLRRNIAQERYKDIRLIPKRRRSRSAEEVAAHIREIARMKPGDTRSSSLEVDS